MCGSYDLNISPNNISSISFFQKKRNNKATTL